MTDAIQFHRLRDNEDISREEHAKVCAVLDDVRLVCRGTRAYVARQGLDPEVFLPASIWADISRHADMVDWSYDLVNRVRAASPFSGFETLMWARQGEQDDIDAAKKTAFYGQFFSGQLERAAIDERLDRDFMLRDRMAASREELIATYDRLTTGVPERYRLPTPRQGGDIGLWHRDRILNPDLVTYQGRLNGMYGAGSLRALERAMVKNRTGHYLEIGPGHCYFAWALRECIGRNVQVHLIDLPSSMFNGMAYLSCVAGTDAIGLVTEHTRAPIDKPFVFIPNHLVPAYEPYLPSFDLVHNAISLNEMNVPQVRYYLDFIKTHLAARGVFHLCGGQRVADYHTDAFAEATERLPRHKIYWQDPVEGISTIDHPHTLFFGAARHSLPLEAVR